MSALTERKKKEIESLFLKMKQKTYKKVMLYVTCNIQGVNQEPIIVDRILKTINNMNAIESASYDYGTNTITVTANWKDYEISQMIESIKAIPNVLDIKAYILNPLF